MEHPPHRPHADFHSPLRLRVENLAVARGGRRVLDGVSFALSGGEALVVTGRNGVGKSTMLRAIAGLLPRAGGTVALEGGAAEAELAQQTHYLAHADGMKAALTVAENLDFWAGYLSREPDPRSRSVADALAVVGLSHALDAPFGALSAGQKRRAALARLLVAFRPLWLLDEPMTALDRGSREKFAKAMRDHCALGGLIVAATHEPLGLEEAAELPLGALK
ncbi:heme ABC exporter ATP-binding protein CcmA [Methylocystis sp. WRRC1]|uniref:heme ABC exporter ATP-binding protein CcmA n=1 Tax=Methylocystis sp. WRRC1 TaxID=1732014 RepID=UPI001D14EA3F|nr:heme ABC exporter ATP-binding protein CcmA [Methylocystis sp. WRRC1]MCC3245232.1 heme ABC exporter ATP-binding protein CcmA [Methylocystis sp. WRRC1]